MSRGWYRLFASTWTACSVGTFGVFLSALDHPRDGTALKAILFASTAAGLAVWNWLQATKDW